MKIYGMYGWDFPNGGFSGPSGFDQTTSPVANTPFVGCGLGIDTSMSWTVDVNGWFLYRTTRAQQLPDQSYRHRTMMDMKSVIPSLTAASNIFVGFRFKVTGLYVATEIISIGGTVNGSFVTVFSMADLPAYAIDKSYYLEYQLDFANSIIRRRVNGAPLGAVGMPAWMLTAVSAVPAGNSIWHTVGAQGGYFLSGNQNHSFAFKDMMIIEWESGELAQFFGDQFVAKLAVNVVTAATWTPSTGTISSVFKTGYSNPTTPIASPTATTDAAMTPGSITFDASGIPLNTKISGILVKGRSAVTGATTGTLGISATVNGVESPDTNITMVAAQTWYDRMLTMTKTPAGLAWTQPGLAGLTLKAKPKV